MEDLEEWQVLPEDGFLEIHNDGGKKIFSRRYYAASENIFKNYFICPSPKQSSKFVESTEKAVKVPNQFVPVPIQLEAAPIQGPQDDQVSKQVPTREINLNKPSSALPLPLPLPEKIRRPEAPTPAEADQDLVSQVFFKKETEFVDMKMDSPKSNNNNNSSWGIKPQQMVQFQEKGEPFKVPGDEKVDEEEMMKTRTSSMDGGVDTEKEVGWDEHSGGLNNIFKWSLTGIGAICSFGVATVCIIAFGGLIKNTNKQQHQQNQKLQFHIYAEDKRLKQVVHHHATKMNEAISAVRGMPPTKAHITFGGYYDAL